MKTIIIILVLIIASSAYSMTRGEYKERECLALNIYFEARNQPIEGQKAIGFVTLNRVFNSRFPDSICGVVKQYKQFSWYSDGKPDVPTDRDAWNVANNIANYVLSNYDQDNTGGALYYHADYVTPYWIKSMKLTQVLHTHLFYKK